jgi:hypothetical protein
MAVNQNNEAQVAQWANESVVQIFPTIAKLRLLPTANNPDWTKGQAIAVVLGNSAAFDQALKIYAWDADLTTADNGTTIIKPTAIDTDATQNPTNKGRWRSP